ncbi:hypothetical protein [Amycolatopsis sp. Hca4]|uniref:hypothetical protein n=1 Tax=Amycolatopsis sp. Hca4 TaxID=2742131 RepID=UPI0015909084|nr:hypothetical protein [Amycolatopsis sp. Hca4]QKV80452.1 hypothetical protein HUT10_46735 [Amycolatopsis sp. Hca4]
MILVVLRRGPSRPTSELWGGVAAAPSAFEQALRFLRRGGRLVCVGIPAGGVLPVPIFEAVIKGISGPGPPGDRVPSR